jgi:hypothetical protein
VSSDRFYPQARAVLQVVFEGFGDSAKDSEIEVIPVLPKSVTLHRNSYNQADSWELEFDAGDLPIDPQLVRAGAVEIYLFQVDEAEYRVLSRREPLAEPDPGGLRPRDPADTAALELGTAEVRDRFTYGNKPQMAGLFDQDQLSMSDDGKWVRIQGQDYTAHLSALQWKPLPNGRARRIPAGKRLDVTLRELLLEADDLGRLQLELRGVEESELPIVGKNEVGANKRGIPVDQNTTYWDVMYKLATRHGFILFVDGLSVVLAAPRNLPTADSSRIKRMAWGRNIESLELTRNLGKQQSPTIVMRGYDPKTREVVDVVYPEGSFHVQQRLGKTGKAGHKFKEAVKEHTHVSKTGKVTTTVRKRDEYQIIPAYGVTDRVTLRRMAETRYELLGRAEREVVFRTHDLRDMNESDILQISAGDAYLIDWDDFNVEVLANADMTREDKIRHLVNRGFNAQLAGKIADAYAKLQALQRPLRVHDATIEYDVDGGVSIEAQLVDFIVVDGVRHDSENDTERRTPADRAHQRRRNGKGRPVGWTKEREAAELARRGIARR